MKAKNITAEDLSAMATEAGMQVPKAFIEKKLAKINEKEGERSGSSSGSPRRHGGRPMMQVLKQFLKSKDINAEELAEFAQEKGFKVKAERISKFLSNETM
jgi:ribosomal protein L12E/L44/L45/RPP1/RPP2